MPKAVRFERYGGPEVLAVVDVPRPAAGADEVLVKVKAAGINPGEAKIREGLLHERWPATFPSGQGSDLAGVVAEVGPGVTTVAPGDEVIAFTHNRASQAEYVVVDAADTTPKPEKVSWEIAGSLFVAGATAWAVVRAVAPKPGEVVAVAGAAGGVGSLTVQLARSTGARVLGIAGPDNQRWLADHGVVGVRYGDGLAGRLREAAGGAVSGGTVDAFIDLHGDGYVELALSLGVDPGRIDTVADFAAVGRYGVKGDGNMVGASAAVMAELAALVADGRLEVPIARTYPLDDVQNAYRDLERGHTRGKIVLVP